jgi:hypothetical protein
MQSEGAVSHTRTRAQQHTHGSSPSKPVAFSFFLFTYPQMQFYFILVPPKKFLLHDSSYTQSIIQFFVIYVPSQQLQGQLHNYNNLYYNNK